MTRKESRQRRSYSKQVLAEITTGLYSIPAQAELLRQLILSQDQSLLGAAATVAHEVAKLEASPALGSPHSLIVGGFVRDSVIGLAPKDIDMQVYGVPPGKLLELIERIHPGRFERVGKSYEIIKIRLNQAVALDLSIARRVLRPEDTAFEAGDSAMPPREAAALRDFSMNNLAADPLSGEVFDWWGGLADLRQRRLRITSPDYFELSPIQVYRGVQFAARLELEPSAECFEQMRQIALRGGLTDLAPRRVVDELEKLLLRADRPSVGLELMRRLGILTLEYPELATLSEGAWENALRFVDTAALRLKHRDEFTAAERIAAALVGVTAELNRPAAEKLLNRFAFSKQVRYAALACNLMCGHPEKLYREYADLRDNNQKTPQKRPNPLVRSYFPRRGEKSMLRDRIISLLKELHPVRWQFFSEMAGLRTKNSSSEALRQISEEVARGKLEEYASATLIDRTDLTDGLRLSRGPLLGYIIGEVEKRRLDFYSKEEALEFVRSNLSELLDLARERLGEEER